MGRFTACALVVAAASGLAAATNGHAQNKPATNQPAGSAVPCDERFEFFTIDGRHVGWLDDKTGSFHIDGENYNDVRGPVPIIPSVNLSPASGGGLGGSAKFQIDSDPYIGMGIRTDFEATFEVSPDGKTARLLLNIGFYILGITGGIGSGGSVSDPLSSYYYSFLAVAQRCGKKPGGPGDSGAGKSGTSGTPGPAKSGMPPDINSPTPVTTPSLTPPPGGSGSTPGVGSVPGGAVASFLGSQLGQINSSVQTYAADGGSLHPVTKGAAKPAGAPALAGMARAFLSGLLQRPWLRDDRAVRRADATRRVGYGGESWSSVRAGRSGDQGSENVQATLVSTGGSTGEVLELQIVSTSDQIRFTVPDALIIEPLRGGSSMSAPVAAGRTQTYKVAAYCLDFGKAPAAPGVRFRIAAPAAQERHAFAGHVLRAARTLDARKKLTPDSDPTAYLDAIKQYALWTRLEGWDEKTFGEKFLDRTKKNFAELKQRWTRDVEEAVRAAVPGRWRDITAVLAETDRLAGPRAQ